MEHYYFIQKDGVKQGPLKLAELKLMTIYFDELIWRSDDDQWKKASEFEELQDIFIIKPPLTPIEEKKKDFSNYFFTTILPFGLGIYVFISLIITGISFSIATKGWEDEKNRYIINKEDVGENIADKETKDLDSIKNELLKLRQQNEINQNGNFDYLTVIEPVIRKITILQLDSTVHEINISNHSGIYAAYNQVEFKPIFKIPENVISMENINGLQQSFLFRAYYAFFSKIYLTRVEQSDSGTLFLNIAISSFLSLLILLIMILAVYYFINNSVVNEE